MFRVKPVHYCSGYIMKAITLHCNTIFSKLKTFFSTVGCSQAQTLLLVSEQKLDIFFLMSILPFYSTVFLKKGPLHASASSGFWPLC
mgnify:CR=1 FL=1